MAHDFLAKPLSTISLESTFSCGGQIVLMCVDCVLASSRIAQVDPEDEPLPEVVLSHWLPIRAHTSWPHQEGLSLQAQSRTQARIEKNATKPADE
jgi:hypothetical protein